MYCNRLYTSKFLILNQILLYFCLTFEREGENDEVMFQAIVVGVAMPIYECKSSF